MRRYTSLALALVAGAALVACEDGPHQTYTPPSSGAANIWNNGSTNSNPLPGVGGSASQNFTGSNGGGNTGTVLCTGSQQQAAWVKMDAQPVTLPNNAAGLNEAGQKYNCPSPGVCTPTGSTTWAGLTIEQAEDVLCQGTYAGDAFGDGNEDIAWGGSDEVDAEYIVSSQRVDYVGLDLFGAGYLGTLTVTSPYQVVAGALTPGNTTYTISLNMVPIYQQVGSGPRTAVTLDWEGYFDGTDPVAITTFDNIYRAVMATYFSGLPQESPNTTCDVAGDCEIDSFSGGYAALYLPIAGWGIWVDPYTDPNASQLPDRMDIYVSQIMNYAFAQPYLQMNGTGPITLPQILGAAATPCSLLFGMDYGNFLSNCVQTDATTAENANELNKLLAGMTHDDETFNFNIPGVDLNFNDLALTPTEIVTDWDPGVSTPTPTNSPQPGDTANEMNVDQSTPGNIANDWVYDANDIPIGQDLHSAGAMWDEYRRLVMVNVYNESNPSLPPMDPASSTADSWVAAQISKCIPPRNPADGSLQAYPPGSGSFDPAAWIAFEQSNGCTGAENLISADTTTSDDPVNVGPQIATALDPNYAVGMKMGHQPGLFCLDAASLNQINAGATPIYCNSPYGAEGDILTTTAQQVWAIWGQGNVNNMPIDIRDYRFFFKMYGQALIKTLEWDGDWNTTVSPWTPPTTALKAYPIEFNDLFYDSIGAGQFETMEYIDRRYVCADSTLATPDNDCAYPATGVTTSWQPAIDISFGADIKDGIMNNYDITRYYYRGETALYQVFQQPDPNNAGSNYAVGKPSDALLTNIAGSPVISQAWPSGGASPLLPSPYACATLDPNDPGTTPAQIAACQGQVAPVDSSTGLTVRNPDGNLLLEPYALAFPAAGTTVLSSPLALGSESMQVNLGSTTSTGENAPTQAQDFEYAASAQVTLPTLLGGETLPEFVPYFPSQAGIGFDVAVNGAYDQFVQTEEVDLTGVTDSVVVDYIPVTNAFGGTSNQILAVESQDFLGDVFMCRDTATGDVLSVRMYDTVASVLDWMNAHPNSYFGSPSTECNMVVRWSTYDNYIDFIESTTNGVRLQVTQGGGFGRVVGATVYVPGNYGVQ